MDSDGLVLRKLVVSDFLGTDNFIKDFVVDNNSIELNKYWIRRYSCKRKQYLSDIETFFRIKKFVTAHGFVSLSVEIMKEFDRVLIDKIGLYRYFEFISMEFRGTMVLYNITVLEYARNKSFMHSMYK